MANRLVHRLQHGRAVRAHPLRHGARVERRHVDVGRRMDLHGRRGPAGRPALAAEHRAKGARLGRRHDELVVMDESQHVLRHLPHADIGRGDRAGHAGDRRLGRRGRAGRERPHEGREETEHAGEAFGRRRQDRADHRGALRAHRRRGAGLFRARSRRDAGRGRRRLHRLADEVMGDRRLRRFDRLDQQAFEDVPEGHMPVFGSRNQTAQLRIEGLLD